MENYNYMVLGYNGIDYFARWWDVSKFPNTKLLIIDNGKQTFPEHLKENLIHQNRANIGCSGGWNLALDIAFNHLGLEKVIIGQEDARVSEEIFEALLEHCNPDTICGTYNNGFNLSTYAIHHDTFTRIGRFDENFVYAGCEDNDYMHRAKLAGVEIKSLGISNTFNASIANNNNVVPVRSSQHNADYVARKWNNYTYTIPWNGEAVSRYTDYFKELYGEPAIWPSEMEFNLFKETQLLENKMKIAFHSNQLGIRGTEIALYDYAYYNREILGNDSVIISDKNADLAALDKFKSEFDVFLYNDFTEVHEFVKKNGIGGIYYQKSGQLDGKLVPGIRNMVHTVFQFNQPHGDVYSFISPWLAEKMTCNRDNSVPYIVDILKYDHNQNYREELGIPEDAIVFGYYGGPTSFNIEFARQAVRDVAQNNPNIFFLFMNSETFCDLPNTIFIEATTDYKKKIGFINTCDACIHARNGGESFGLTVAEFSIKNKPVITTTYCTEALCDMAHIEMLGEKAVLYNNYEELVGILTNFSNISNRRSNWNAYAEYNPVQVMKQFKKVFLS